MSISTQPKSSFETYHDVHSYAPMMYCPSSVGKNESEYSTRLLPYQMSQLTSSGEPQSTKISTQQTINRMKQRFWYYNLLIFSQECSMHPMSHARLSSTGAVSCSPLRKYCPSKLTNLKTQIRHLKFPVALA